MSDLQIFNFNNKEIRTLAIEGEPYFVGKDVADILGYQNGSRDINRHVDEEDRHKAMIFDGNQYKETITINESGLYSLILSSKLPKAKEFKHWVTHEVLPTIRKHGAYMTPAKIEEVLTDPDTIIQLATQLKQEREGRLIAEQRIGELTPKADYCDRVLADKSLVTITQIAKDYGMSGRALNATLHDFGISVSSTSREKRGSCMPSIRKPGGRIPKPSWLTRKMAHRKPCSTRNGRKRDAWDYMSCLKPTAFCH